MKDKKLTYEINEIKIMLDLLRKHQNTIIENQESIIWMIFISCFSIVLMDILLIVILK